MTRRALVFLSLWTLLLMLSACSNAPELSQRAQDAAKPVLTTIRVAFPEAGGYQPILDPVITAFQHAHSGYRVEKVPMKTDYANVVAEFLREGKADVALVNVASPDLVRSKLIVDIGPYIQSSGFDLGKVGVGPRQIQYNGTIYGLPLTASPRVLLANVGLFEQAGVPLPQDSWTWDQFREAARKLSTGEDSNRRWGLGGHSVEFMAQMMLLESTGENPAWRADEKAVRDTLQYWSTLIHTDRAAPPPPNDQSGPLQRSMDTSLFWEGKAGMVLQGWSPEMAQRPPFNLALLPVPTTPGKKASLYVWYNALVLPANAQSTDAGWEFIRFAAGPEGALALAQHGMLPMYMTTEAQEAWVKSIKLPGAGMITGTRWTGHFGSEGLGGSSDYRLTELLDQAINGALSGAKDWEKAAADFSTAAGKYK